MAGRKPLPTEVKKTKGNPGGKPLNLSEPKAKKAVFSPPPDYVKKQKFGEEIWNTLLPLVIEMGTGTMADLPMLGNLCVALSIHREATIKLGRGLMYKSVTEEGGVIQRKSPYIDIINTQARIAQSLASEFGLTPSARSKINLGGKKDDDPLSGFIN